MIGLDAALPFGSGRALAAQLKPCSRQATTEGLIQRRHRPNQTQPGIARPGTQICSPFVSVCARSKTQCTAKAAFISSGVSCLSQSHGVDVFALASMSNRAGACSLQDLCEVRVGFLPLVTCCICAVRLSVPRDFIVLSGLWNSRLMITSMSVSVSVSVSSYIRSSSTTLVTLFSTGCLLYAFCG